MRSFEEKLGLWAPASWTASFKIFHFSSIAGYEDYLLCGAAVAPLCIELEPPDTANFPEVSPETMKEMFIRGDTGTGAIIQLTLTTVYTVLARPPLLFEKEFMLVNAGTPEWCVAAMLLSFTAMHPEVLDFFINAKYHLVPLPEWRTLFKAWLNAVRRCPILQGCPNAGVEDVMIVRKILNVTFRSKEDADWEAEYQRRVYNTPVHYGLGEDGRMSRALWEADIQFHVDQLAHELVGNTIAAARLDPLQEWWDARWAWCPGGSSSNRRVADNLKSDDPRLGSGARPSKKTVFEELPSDYAAKTLREYPFLYVARGSTKHEPGGKARALMAANDEAFVITSYASVHLEKHMNVWGIRAKQTPADVVEWICMDRLRRANERWLSLDYADYNTEHEMETKAKFNFALARAWSKLGGNQAFKCDKVRCALWAALAHHNKWVSEDTRGVWRVFGGLFSGDRDTARDNTALHGVYSRIAFKYTRLLDPKGVMIASNYTGDDEDTLLGDWATSYLYLAMHAHMGFVLKPEKQLCSTTVHEFLQRMAVPHSLPLRPLYAALAQFASGNWYKDVYSWYDSSVQAISDNVWEMVTRGLPIVYGRRLAVETLNAAMRVPTEAGWKRLEWWSFRHSGLDAHPLWAGTLGPVAPGPSIEAKPMPGRAAKGQATHDWIAMKQRELGQGLKGHKGWEVYAKHCLKEGYASFYIRSRADTHREYALNQWPERVNHPMGLDAPAPPRLSNSVLNTIVMTNATDRRPAKEDEVLARMGLDAPLVAALGGLAAVLPHMAPTIMRFYSSPDAVGHTPIELQWEDPAVRSWWGSTAVGKTSTPAAQQRALEKHYPALLPEKLLQRQRRWIFVAPNGAGKSTYCSTHPWCCDTDAIVSATHSSATIHMNTKLGVMPRPDTVARHIHDLLTRLNYSAITTQMAPDMVLLPAALRAYDLQIVIVDVPRAVLFERLTERGWTYDKVIRRIARWDNVKSLWLSITHYISHVERSAIRVADSFPTKL